MTNNPQAFPSKERPIIFNAEMVRAILEGRKTQTRRIIGKCHLIPGCDPMDVQSFAEKCPFGQPGDRLWVRETFCFVSPDEYYRPFKECNIEYKADSGEKYPGNWGDAEDPKHDPDCLKWKPSIHMPRWASRITLEITNVRVERIQDISPNDVIKEGIIEREGDGLALRDKFEELWNAIYPGSWERNDWVWVVEFKMLEARNMEGKDGR